MRHKNKSLAIVTFLLASSCINYTNKIMDWSDSIPKTASPADVKLSEPDYISTDWEHPDTLENGIIRFYITEIKNDRDFLSMIYFIEFEDNKYRSLFGRK